MNTLHTYIFGYRLSPSYGFIAGIVVSLSLNAFVTALLSVNMQISRALVIVGSGILLVASFGFYGVNMILEGARTAWEAEGANRDHRMHYHIERRLTTLWLALAVGVLGLAAGVIILLITVLCR